MKIHIYITALMILAVTLPTISAGGEHKAGALDSCFYDSNYSAGSWHYYFCGKIPDDKKCAGKRCGSRKTNFKTWFTGNSDACLDFVDLELFTFATTQKETYCCCGGTADKAGRFVKAENTTNCYKKDPTVNGKPNPQKIPRDLGNGQVCNDLVYQTVCGTEYRVTCTVPEPQQCLDGYKWRQKECAPICTGDTVYENEYSNKCVQCPTTNFQGTDKNREFCIKCDQDTELFDRTKAECIQKNSKNVKQYHKDAMRECWRCPDALFAECVNAVTERAKSNTALPTNIKNKCHLN